MASFNPILLLFILPLGFVGLWALSKGVTDLVVWQRLAESDAAAAYDLQPGPVELAGMASVFDATLPAPFEDAETLVYEYTVERYRYDDDGSNWDTVDSGTVGVPFVLTCDGVEIVVDPGNASLMLENHERIELDGDEEPTGALARFIQNNEEVTHRAGSVTLGPISLSTGTRHRFTVSRLDPGETVYVAGTLTPAYNANLETDDQQWVVERQSRSWLERIRAPTPLLIADTNEHNAEKRIRNSALFTFAIGVVLSAVALGLLLV